MRTVPPTSARVRPHLAVAMIVTGLASFGALPASAQDLGELLQPNVKPQIELTVSPFGPSDLRKTEQQRAQVAELARRRIGIPLGRDTATDLSVLQRLLDGGHVGREDVYLQQSLGVVLGDALDRDLRILRWAVVDDKYGHSRALQYRTTDQVFFPITMVPKRLKAGERVDFRALYDQVRDAAERLELDRDTHLRRTEGRR